MRNLIIHLKDLGILEVVVAIEILEAQGQIEGVIENFITNQNLIKIMGVILEIEEIQILIMEIIIIEVVDAVIIIGIEEWVISLNKIKITTIMLIQELV